MYDIKRPLDWNESYIWTYASETEVLAGCVCRVTQANFVSGSAAKPCVCTRVDSSFDPEIRQVL